MIKACVSFTGQRQVYVFAAMTEYHVYGAVEAIFSDLGHREKEHQFSDGDTSLGFVFGVSWRILI